MDIKRPLSGAAVLRGDITEAIQDALVHELARVGYGRLSIEAVARRAGVGKTAVYRRWASKLDMVLEIVGSAAGAGLPVPDTGSLDGDVELLLRFVARALKHRLASQIIPDLLAEAARNDQIAEKLSDVLLSAQRDVSRLIVERAVARGELAADVAPDVAVDLVIGPVYWHLAVTRAPLPNAMLAALAKAATVALRAAADANAAAGERAAVTTGKAVAADAANADATASS
jgi:AcrR family transcriptional regulator